MSTLQRDAFIEFGAFQIDLDSGELRKRGVRIKLQNQPFRVLVTLLSKPGEIVTREELQQAIWGTNTSVDFERGLASAINKLREALGDSAENPRYVETLAKRGYRFIAPVAHDPPPGSEVQVFPPLARTLEAPSETREESPGLEVEIPLLPKPAPANAASIPAETPAPSRGVSLGPVPAFALMMLVLTLLGISFWLGYRTIHTPRPSRLTRIEQLTQAGEIFAGLPDPENLPVLVTDGPRIYTSTYSYGKAGLSSIDLSEARLQAVGIPDEISPVAITDLSRDGSKLLLRSQQSRESEQPLWVVPTSGSSAQRVGEILAHDAAWMPDGRSILYAEGDELGIAQLDTGTTSLLVKLPGRAFWPRWSPDASLLRFTLVDPITHASSLWEWEASSHRLRQLELPQLAGFTLCCGSWTADGKAYLFEASSARGSDIWAAETGANPTITELTNGPLRYISPVAARDGRTVYFVGLDQPADMQVYDLPSSSFGPAPAYLRQAQRVTYSRDGAWVAWTDGESRLWRARSADGSGRVQLTADDLQVYLAHWSPDGTHLVLMARKPGETWQIYLVSAQGGMPRLLLKEKRNLADPDWSADGQEIVFGRQADMMGKEDGPHDLEVLDLRSQKVREVEGSENLFSPRWSPDGRWIAALSIDQTQLVLYNVERRTWSTLYRHSAADPVWSADSRLLYFHAFAELGSPVLRMNLDGTSAPVADLAKHSLASANTYFFGGITPAGLPLVKPRIGTGNLYAIGFSR